MTTRPQRVLVVDDEPQITRVLRTAIGSRGYEVRIASDGESALELFSAWPPDLVVTDISMPGMDGIELCHRIRERSTVPILVLSVRGEEKTKVDALDAGADDYVTKPFGTDELLARVRAVLRRAPIDEAGEDVKQLSAGDFEVDLETRAVTVGDRHVHLTPKEFDLLVYLVRHRDTVITHRRLLDAVWGRGHGEQVEYLRVFVGQLRKKIEEDPSSPRYLRTEPWVGYRFVTGD